MNPIQSLSITDIKTASGATFAKLNLYYQHFGQPLDKAPVVLINHSLTGDADVAGPKGWWKELVGSEKTIDTNQYAVLAFNIPGNGAEGQLLSNPKDFHAGDIATLFLKGLELLGVSKLHALVGGSIGGGIAWEMAVIAPQLTQYLIPIAADWKANDWILANTFLQNRILENSSNPLEDARIHAMLTYRSPQSFDYRFGRTKNEELGIYNIESWLIHHGKKLAERFHLEAYVLVNHLLASVNIERNGKKAVDLIKKIDAEIHLIAVDSDLFFTPFEDQKTFEMVKPEKASIFYHELKSIHGHDAFLIENDSMEQILSPLFKN
ncbi:alpha/beta fold hydrolase [Flavobacteriaceae bacterium]|nr:alpha/beta fold hydrolase [Flavobacteriaceae bacterium]MDA9016162.1 alpha/beta fold hydrolase [Flavobacteriaceae bacterium]